MTTTTVPSRCTLELITTNDALEKIGPLWDRLAARARLTNPFLTYDWIRTWWECFRSNAELCIVIVRADDEPIAIAPLMRTTERVYGAQTRCLRFIANEHTPRCDFIVGARPDEAYAAICDFVMSGSADWDMVQLRDIPADSQTLPELQSRAEDSGILSGVRQAAASLYIRTTSDWDHYVMSLPSKRRWFLRNRLRRLATKGAVSFETVRGGSGLGDALEDGFRLEAAAWKEKAGTAILCQPEILRFYTILAERAAARGWLRLQFLKVGDRRIAFAYCLEYEERMYLLKPGFDPEYAAYSPGNLLCYYALQDVYSSGLVAYEFLGDDDHWKRQWAHQTVGHSSLFLYANRPLTRLAHYTKFAVIPTLQQFRLYELLRDFVFGQTT
jgi:CelD/BcsL family acetyltransferase involved in cellulose biosynthesis